MNPEVESSCSGDWPRLPALDSTTGDFTETQFPHFEIQVLKKTPGSIKFYGLSGIKSHLASKSPLFPHSLAPPLSPPWILYELSDAYFSVFLQTYITVHSYIDLKIIICFAKLRLYDILCSHTLAFSGTNTSLKSLYADQSECQCILHGCIIFHSVDTCDISPQSFLSGHSLCFRSFLLWMVLQWTALYICSGTFISRT